MPAYADFLRSRRYEHALSVQPAGSDVTVSSCDAIWIGTGGTLKVDTEGGETGVSFTVATNTLLPLSVIKVYNSGTTASGLIAMWSKPGG